MSNVVQFLEALSHHPMPLSDDEFVAAISASTFDSSTRDALLRRDPIALNNALGGRATVLAFIFPAEPEQEGEKRDGEQQPDDGHEGPEHAPEKDSRAA